jgi:uncharacterized protein YifN (PemK superfamily)
MGLIYHPKRGTILLADFSQGFREPEMVKRRLCVVVSPPIEARVGLCTVVPLSQTAPKKTMPYHYQLEIPFQMPSSWGGGSRWVKGDMVCAVGFHRLNLLRLGRGRDGKRRYQTNALSADHMRRIDDCLRAGLGLPPLTS